MLVAAGVDAVLTGGAPAHSCGAESDPDDPDPRHRRRSGAERAGDFARPSRWQYDRDQHPRDRARRQAAGVADGAGSGCAPYRGSCRSPRTPRPSSCASWRTRHGHAASSSRSTLPRNPRRSFAAIDAAQASGAQALNVLAAPSLDANRRLIIERTATLKLTAIYQWPEIVEAGGLAAYGPRQTEVSRQRARQLVKIFRGAKPGDIPVEQPDKFELVINLQDGQGDRADRAAIDSSPAPTR